METVIKTIGVIGARGKLGSAIVQAAKEEFEVLELIRGQSFEKNQHLAEVWIDASSNDASREHAACANKPLIICTTGAFDYQSYVSTQPSSSKAPILFAPNTSLAFAYIRRMLSNFSSWQAVIGDVHYHTKKDSPSGTTKDLMNLLPNNPSHFSFRNNISGAKMQIFLNDMDEMIEVSYTTFNRAPYASGAIELSKWLVNKKPGVYIVENFVESCE